MISAKQRRAHKTLAEQWRAHKTRAEQREAGPGLHPRGLARSVAKERGAGKHWRQELAGMPKQGQKYLHPERRRTIRQA